MSETPINDSSSEQSPDGIKAHDGTESDSTTQTDSSAQSVPLDHWQQLKSASLQQQLEAWLALQAGLISHLQSILLLTLDEQRNQLKPVAQWFKQKGAEQTAPGTEQSASRHDPADLLEIVNQVIEELQPQLVHLPNHAIALAFPLIIQTKLQAVVALSLDTREQDIVNQAMYHLRWGSGMLELLFQRRQVESQSRQLESFRHSVELLTEVAAEQQFFSASQRLVSMLSARFHCNWAAAGWKHKRLKLTVISHQTQQVNKMNLVRAIEDAMSEAIMMRETIICNGSAEAAYPAHAQLIKAHQLSNIITVPMFHKNQYLGAVCLEREADRPFTEQEQLLLNDVLQVLAPVLDDKKSRDRNIFLKCYDSLNTQLKRLFGAKYYGRKIALLSIIALALILALVKVQYQVNAQAVLKGEQIRMISAPFEGYIESAPVRAGDRVKAGALLVKLDDRDLRLERLNWQTRKIQLQREQQEAASQYDRAEAKIKAAEVEQAQAQLELAESRLARTELTAAFDGLIVEGDLSQRLGGLVQKGEVLMQLTPLKGYRADIQVDESQIDHIKIGQQGILLLRALPDEPVEFHITRITPVSEIRDGINYFTVEASLNRQPEALRPGMEGIAKVNAGQRPLYFVLSRGLMHWLRVSLWKWLP